MDLEKIIRQGENATLFEPESLLRRLELLDALDSSWANSDGDMHRSGAEFARMLGHAEGFRSRLEASNAEVFGGIREEIRRGSGRKALLPWLEQAVRMAADGRLFPGLAFDASDEIVSGVLQLREPEKRWPLPSPEMVFYQPTPVRHIMRFLELGELAADDVLFDLGAGLGHVPLLASILTGARCVGVELDAGAVECARECAQRLGLERARFVKSDAREADLSEATVFYLYTPFSGTILEAVLRRLRGVSEKRVLRIGTLGPCTAAVAREMWLTTVTAIDPGQITMFQSHV